MPSLFARLNSLVRRESKYPKDFDNPYLPRISHAQLKTAPDGQRLTQSQLRYLSQVTLNLPRKPPGRSRFKRRLNKLCDVADWRGKEWDILLNHVGRGVGARKAWEWTHGLYGLQQLGVLNENTTALGVGAGTEAVLYYMTNHMRQVVATDIYGIGNFANHEASASMLDKPEAFAPFPYHQERLVTRYMDGRKLEFNDGSFDVAFSFSSIEHFGGHAAATQSMQEITRVLRPGGVAIIATELILNGIPHEEYFLPHEIDQYLVQPSGLRLIEDIDFRFSGAMQRCPLVDLGAEGWINTSPHILCHLNGMVWTSLLLFFEKPVVA